MKKSVKLEVEPKTIGELFSSVFGIPLEDSHDKECGYMCRDCELSTGVGEDAAELLNACRVVRERTLDYPVKIDVEDVARQLMVYMYA